MLGQLPNDITVNGKKYEIDSDYRNILTIFTCYADEELKDSEKVYITLERIYKDFNSIRRNDYREAYEKALLFISMNKKHDEDNKIRIVNWEKDEQLIFPAVNKSAGCEVRALPYLHWWTFMGYFQSIDGESLLGFVLTIRQKRAKGKKLEKYEQEFLNSNFDLCNVDFMDKRRSANDDLLEMFNELLKDGGTDGR